MAESKDQAIRHAIAVEKYFQEQVHECEEKLNRLREHLDNAKGYRSSITSVPSRIFGESQQQARSFRELLTDTIYLVLRGERPLHRTDVLERVVAQGVHVGGNDPLSTIAPYMTSDARFTSDGRGNWTLAEEVQVEKDDPKGEESESEATEKEEYVGNIIDLTAINNA